MEELVVVGILLGTSVVVIVCVMVAYRIVSIWKKTSTFSFFSPNEEKTSLTKAEQLPAYKVTSEENLSLCTTDKGYKQYASSQSTTTSQKTSLQDRYSEESEIKADRSSPTSSLASDHEPTSGLQRALSCESVDSVSSVMEYEPEPPRIGQLEFGLEYDHDDCELIISIIQARDLEKNETTGSLDSYVKLWITPSRQPKSQTKIVRDSTDPVYKERFLFSLDPEELPGKVINLQVLSCDKYARQKMLGEAELKTDDIDLRRHPIRIWMNLRDMDQKPTELGDIMFSLSYLPTAERLTVVIVKCRSLKWTGAQPSGDCFVKLYLLQNGKKVSKKKTSTKRDATDPIFNEAMMFSVPGSALNTLQLRLSVIEQRSDGTSGSVGHVIVGSQLSGTELTHWNQMMTSLRKPVAMWHSLRK